MKARFDLLPEKRQRLFRAHVFYFSGDRVMNSCSELFKSRQISPLTNGQSCHWYAAYTYALDRYDRQAYPPAKQRDQP